MLIMNAENLGTALGRFHQEKKRGSSVIRISNEGTELLRKAKWLPNVKLMLAITDQGVLIKPLSMG